MRPTDVETFRALLEEGGHRVLAGPSGLAAANGNGAGSPAQPPAQQPEAHSLANNAVAVDAAWEPGRLGGAGGGAGSNGAAPAVPEDWALYVSSTGKLHRLHWSQGVPVTLAGEPGARGVMLQSPATLPCRRPPVPPHPLLAAAL